MDGTPDMTVNVGINVSHETANRCCQLLSMYLTDHPEFEVITLGGVNPDTEDILTIVSIIRRKEKTE